MAISICQCLTYRYGHRKLCMNVAKNIREIAQGEKCLEYCESRTQLGEGTRDDVDWDTVGRAMASSTTTRRQWVTKHVSRISCIMQDDVWRNERHLRRAQDCGAGVRMPHRSCTWNGVRVMVARKAAHFFESGCGEDTASCSEPVPARRITRRFTFTPRLSTAIPDNPNTMRHLPWPLP